MKILRKMAVTALLGIAFTSSVLADTIQLPAPVKTGGKPFMEVLNARKSTKAGYINQDLDLQTMSDLLWSAYGFNRPDNHRTVPSANNSQEYSIYVLMNKGAYLYDPKANTLTEVTKGSLKDLLFNKQQPYVNDVPVHLAFVGHLDKSKAGRDDMLMDVGYISQNVYLYAASRGLGSVARASFDRTKLAQALKLGPKAEVVLVQAVGAVK